MNVRCKMTCNAKERLDYGSEGIGYEIRLAPVTYGSQENDDVFKWTPGGGVHLVTVNGRAAEGFVIGKEYYVDFSPAE